VSSSAPNKFIRRSRLILLGLSMAAICVALGVMYLAFKAFVEADVAEATRRYVAGLALIAGALLVFALFCVGILLLRYLAYGLLIRRSPGEPTRYVSAWDIAGRRASVPDEDELEDMMGDDDEPRDADE